LSQITHEGVDQLTFFVLVHDKRIGRCTFVADTSLDVVRVLHVGNEDIDFLRVVQRLRQVHDERAKLKEVFDGHEVFLERTRTLSGVRFYHDGWLKLVVRVDLPDDGL